MKTLLTILILSFAFFSCSTEGPSSSSNSYTSKFIVELDSSSVTLSGVKGKALCFANYNCSENKLNTTTTPTNYVKSTSGIDTSTAKEIRPYIESFTDSDYENTHYGNKIKTIDMTEERRIVPCNTDAMPRSEAPDKDPVKESSFKVNESTNILYLDSSTPAEVTLRAKETVNGKTCLVWVANANYGTTSSEDKINGDFADKLAVKFLDYYPVMCDIFGNETDIFIDSREKLSTESPTGDFINIVVYDIDSDFADFVTKGSGTAGLFKPSDLQKNNTKSNKGKYFYIDVGFCNLTDDHQEFTRTDGPSSETYSTLFHEFQHMINYSINDVKNISASTWYTEMLSMLAEDILSESLNLKEKDKPQYNRIKPFLSEYYMEGFDKWNNNTLESYEVTYAFGAFLMRNYGGIEFVKKLKSTGKANMEAILASIGNPDVTKETLVRNFIASCVFRNDFALENDLPTYQAETGTYSSSSGTLTLSKIDLFSSNLSYKLANQKSSGKYLGPLLFHGVPHYDKSQGQYFIYVPQELKPHAFSLNYIGIAISDTVRIEFESKCSKSEQKTYIFIQDDFKNITN